MRARETEKRRGSRRRVEAERGEEAKAAGAGTRRSSIEARGAERGWRRINGGWYD